MGNYITEEILTRRITSARLTALCAGAGTDSSTLVGEVIARAEAVIDGYAAGRYAVPLPASDLVREWALCLAEYELYKRGPGNAVPEKIKESCQQACSQLKDLADGKLQIDSAAPAANGGKSFFTGSADPVFDAGSMRHF
ncbi:MAG: DUF1320 domain-containing protein [Lentisphaeria bacterium]|nr:DUF1320 domain-containing protein [Lentisphaeria bacterium]